MKNKVINNLQRTIVFTLICTLILQMFIPFIKAEAASTEKYQIGKTTDGEIITSTVNPRPLLKSSNGNSSGSWSANYGGYTTSTAFITVNGETAFCIDPNKDFPVNLEYAKQVYNDVGIMNILYYGYPHNGTSVKNYVDTYVALNYYLGHFDSPAMANDSGVKYLLNKAETKTAPLGEFSIANKVQTAEWNPTTKQQETKLYPTTWKSNTKNYQSFTLPEGVKAVTSDGKEYTGNVKMDADADFKLVAGPKFDGTVNITVNTDVKKQTALQFIPSTSNAQRLVKAGGVTDPISVTGIKATFKAQTGDLKIKKTGSDKRTLANAEYDVKDSTGKVVAHVKTGADGTITAKDLLMGDYTVVETKAPAGYTID
ncbi:Cys-Gln thioester bond-forming surface protein, partial [Listeria sp. FSL L7-1515]